MPIPDYTNADFASALQAHFPTGSIWPRDSDAVQSQVCGALTGEFTRLHARSVNLLSDAFPVTPLELLPEWEETLGLPDPCAGPDPTIQVRQQAVHARFIAGGGQSVDYFIGIAAALGYTITISEFSVAEPGPYSAEQAPHTWQVNATRDNYHAFTFGTDNCGDRFATWGGTPLECELMRLKPAQSNLTFAYVL